MNYNSYICRFMNEHEDWEERLAADYGLKIKKYDPFAIFNYSMESDFSNDIVQEARGIIINYKTLDVACWPFRKFGNYNEAYADEIDWSTARVQEKVDGSIIKYWYDDANREWTFATNGMIYASDALASDVMQYSFLDIIRFTDEYITLAEIEQELNKDYTYIFELVSPLTQIVIQYPEARLYHIGTRNRVTGEELDVDLGIDKPAQFPLKSLDDCIKACAELNKGRERVEDVVQEGFVVVDGNWNRVKIKSPEYLFYHHLSTEVKLSKERIITMILDGNIDMADMCEKFPDYAPMIKYYEYKITELQYQADQFAIIVRRLYEEYQHDRKIVAGIIKNHRLSKIGFMALDQPLKSGKEIMQARTIGFYCKMIPDYVRENFTELLAVGGENV